MPTVQKSQNETRLVVPRIIPDDTIRPDSRVARGKRLTDAGKARMDRIFNELGCYKVALKCLGVSAGSVDAMRHATAMRCDAMRCGNAIWGSCGVGRPRTSVLEICTMDYSALDSSKVGTWRTGCTRAAMPHRSDALSAACSVHMWSEDGGRGSSRALKARGRLSKNSINSLSARAAMRDMSSARFAIQNAACAVAPSSSRADAPPRRRAVVDVPGGILIARMPPRTRDDRRDGPRRAARATALFLPA